MPTELVSQEEGYMTSIFRVQGREKEVINFGNKGLVGKRESWVFYMMDTTC